MNFAKVEKYDVEDQVITNGMNLLKSNSEVAKKMMIELGLGLSYCHTISMTIESILKEIDPTPQHITTQEVKSKPKSETSNNEKKVTVVKKAVVTKSVIEKTATSLTTFTNISDNANNSTLRTVRDKGKKQKKIRDPIETDVMVDKNGRKLAKREIAYHKFQRSRFRPLVHGDYVAARPQSQDLFILARVIHDWDLPSNISLDDKFADFSSVSFLFLLHKQFSITQLLSHMELKTYLY